MGLPLVITEPPEYEATVGYIKGRRRNGEEYLIPIHVAQKAVARLNRALDAHFETNSGTVIQFPRRHL